MTELARRRALARNDRDFAAADGLRAEIEAQGWLVTDTAAGPVLSRKPAYAALPGLAALPDHSARPATRLATVALLIHNFPNDIRQCLTALLTHAPPAVMIMGLDLASNDGAGEVLHEFAVAYPGRVEEWHLAAGARPAEAGWGAARTALLRADPAGIHIIMETSTILEGDALSPLLAALDAESVVAAGWRGVHPDPDLRGFHDAAPGPVTALLGHLLAVRRDAALRAGGLPAAARFYRNADLEFSLLLRRQGDLVVPAEPLPVRQDRHRGYYDSDPGYRDRESRRNYRRVLALLREEGHGEGRSGQNRAGQSRAGQNRAGQSRAGEGPG